jgi:hypothetical protein
MKYTYIVRKLHRLVQSTGVLFIQVDYRVLQVAILLEVMFQRAAEGKTRRASRVLIHFLFKRPGW